MLDIAYKSLYQKIADTVSAEPDGRRAYTDLFSLLVSWSEDTSINEADRLNDVFMRVRDMRSKMAAQMNTAVLFSDYDTAEFFRGMIFKTLLMTAPYCFDEYLQAVEYDRPPAEKFYMPRRKVLYPLVCALQDLADDKLDELILSMPPRVGKSTLLLFYETWLIGRNSERHNLYVSYSDIITKAFYNGVLEIINDPVTYKWHDIFPYARIQNTNADEETINIGRAKRYKSLTCRSLYGTLNGACDADGTVIADDLIGSIEEAMSKDRLINVWGKVDNNMIPRAKEKCKILWCGTRWSIIDPIGLREELLTNDEKYATRRYKVIDLPALNGNDESNFNYGYEVGFSTEYYHQRRASFERNNDMPSWTAQYMCEPIERAGAVFESGDMRTYNGVLPDGQPDRVFMAVDPAWGGGDFTAAPVCVQYGDDIYIPAVAYSDGEKTVSQPLLAQVAKTAGVGTMQIEANKMTSDFKIGIEAEMKRIGYRCPIVTRPAPVSKAKEQRIFDKAPDIREHFIFLEDGKRDKAYSLFMQNVYSFKITGKNKHDDAPDSLSMAADMAFHREYERARVFKRVF